MCMAHVLISGCKVEQSGIENWNWGLKCFFKAPNLTTLLPLTSFETEDRGQTVSVCTKCVLQLCFFCMTNLPGIHVSCTRLCQYNIYGQYEYECIVQLHVDILCVCNLGMCN